MMLEGQFPIESQVGLSGVIASNSAKLAKANFWGVTLLKLHIYFFLNGLMSYSIVRFTY
jgi:hypothetical protein